MTDCPNVWTIVVGGGTGRRFGRAKQYEAVGAERVIDRARRIASVVSDGVVLVVPAEDVDREGGVAGGDSRSASVRAGLAAVPADATIICVHDAARPLATADLYRRVIAAVEGGADGAIPGVEVRDTVKVVDDLGVVRSTPTRAALRAVQTPQAFQADRLRAAHERGGEGTDDASLVESIGGSVVVVEGESQNFKITTPDDLEDARRLIAGEASRGHAMIRVGQGFDIHRHGDDPDRPLVLGGVVFEGEAGLVGHSDADVPAHAAADALLGAAGLGDLGRHFPDTEPALSGADSMQILAATAELVRDAGWEIGNVDIKLVCERPKIAAWKDEMESNLSAAAGAPVTVAGRRAEGLGAIGRQEGIAAWAVAVIVRADSS